jgi:hypothetical protein
MAAHTVLRWLFASPTASSFVDRAYANRNVRDVATAHAFRSESARFLAQVYVAIADAQITTWNSKYFYNFWRPVTAIRYADDDNPATEPNPSSSPLVPTRGHPKYPTAHATIAGAFTFTLEHFFHLKKVRVALTSYVSAQCSRSVHVEFTNIDDIVKTAIEGRIYGRMHYCTSGVRRTVIARKVALYEARHYFQPLDDKAGI